MFEENVHSQVQRDDVQRRDDRQKQKMKQYADKKAHVKPSTLTEGDPVLVILAALRKTRILFTTSAITV